ncbi:hypothetical protein EHJ07_09050 [Cronobacter muytjensii]|nr:hypothetical protein [Cronobacter muytjensii]
MTDNLFSVTKLQCIGRYLITVPGALANSNRKAVEINDINISSQRMYLPAFEQRIRLREEDYRKERPANEIDQPFLKQVYRISDHAVIFDRNRNQNDAGFGRFLEGHIYVNGVAFILTTEILDLSDPKYKQDKDEYLHSGSSENELNTKPQKLAEMHNLFARLSGRQDEEIPTQPGVCIPDGFIRDDSGVQREKLTFNYSNKDFNFYFDHDNTLEKGKSLLERSGEIQPELLIRGILTLRKGKRNNSGMEGEEWLVKGRQQIYQPVETVTDWYQFTFYANEKVADNRHPVLCAEMSNEDIVSTPYSKAQLVDIWDRIIGTLKPRPGAY